MVWQPGQSGNPAGPGKAPKLWKDAILRAIKRREESDPQALEKLADRLIRKVAEGDVAAMKEFADRIDGKVPQGIIGGDDDEPAVKVEQIQRLIIDHNPNGKGA